MNNPLISEYIEAIMLSAVRLYGRNLKELLNHRSIGTDGHPESGRCIWDEESCNILCV